MSQLHHAISPIQGTAGSDILYVGESGGAVYGYGGNDTIYGRGNGVAQSHIYAGAGNDRIYMDTTNAAAPFGDHVWGGAGKDEFHFVTDSNQTNKITGRIDDHDHSRDSIFLDGEKIDFENLSSRVRLVEYNDQPWILIDNRILYALEGARIDPGANLANQEERHFINWPSEWGDIPPKTADIKYEDYLDFVPLSVTNGAHYNTINGSDFADDLTGTDGADYINGKDRSDTIHAGAGNDIIDGGTGHDVIHAGAGDDYVAGGLDNDVIYGEAGDDQLFGGSGHDILFGGEGNDRLSGNSGDDHLDGGEGDDILSGGKGDDVLIGGHGSDELLGGSGNDVLIAGNSLHTEGTPSDALDTLNGGAGDDVLFASPDNHTVMTGGEGADAFYLDAEMDATITDFDPAIDTVYLVVKDGKSLEIEKISNDDNGEDLWMKLVDGALILFKGLAGIDAGELKSGLVVLQEQDLLAHEQKYLAEAKHYMSKDKDFVEQDLPYFHRQTKEDEEQPNQYMGSEKREGYQNDDSDSSCFVATASFGGGAHETVRWLRRYRTVVLMQSALGRKFIAFYWRNGPKLAKFVRHDRPSGAMSRAALGAIVRILKVWQGLKGKTL